MTIRSTKKICLRNQRKSLWNTLVRGFEVHDQRRSLETLSDTELRDIGITAAQRDRELRRKFWDFD